MQASTSAPPFVSPDQVLDFWFGAPATNEAEMMAQARRWFAGGAAMDDEVRARFGETVEAALSGKLDGWASTARERLALILVLDQLTRHVYRGQPRAFAGDPEARRLSVEAFDQGMDETLSTPALMFLSMPMLHAEDTTLLRRGAALARRIALGAPALLAKGCAMHVEQSEKYLAIVSRFGRFPHRNAVLGRTSTDEEEAFLVDWAEKAMPQGAPRS